MNKSELLARLRERLTHPSPADEILRLLRIKRIDRASAKRALRHLLEDGSLVLVRGNLYAFPRKSATREPRDARETRPGRTLVGRFERDRLGHGHVVPFDRRASDDVLVPRTAVAGA